MSGGGDVHLNFEFNQQFTASPTPFAAGSCPITRVAKDLLITYDFPGGNNAPTIRAFRWVAGPVDSQADGSWSEVALSAGDVAAAVNQVSITDSLSGGGSIDVQRFGEASINLKAIFGTGEGTNCESFGGATHTCRLPPAR